MVDTTRRTVLAMLGGLLTVSCAGKHGYGSNVLHVSLAVTDEQGRPIPYVTVWNYVLPSKGPLAIDSEDLWRVTMRYQSSFEFATPFNEIVRSLRVLPMGDSTGQVKAVIDYTFIEGYGAPRPTEMQVGFTVMKRGYLPGRIDFSAKSESRIEGKVTLKRDALQSLEEEPYLQEFERIRFELSDTSRNENISLSTQDRNQTLKKGLEAAALQAIAAGDRRAAARIYARMQELPTIQMYDGKAIGFRQRDPYAPESWAWLVKAYELDSDNPYIAAEYLFRRGSEEFGGRKYSPEDASEERKQAFAAYLAQLHALMQKSGPQIWPTFHGLYARWHRKSSDPEERAKVLPMLEEFYRFEPKFQTREGLLKPSF